MAEKKPTGRYTVITILLFAVIFSSALVFSVKSLIKKQKNAKAENIQSEVISPRNP